MNLKVYIATKGRVARQITLEHLPESMQRQVMLVVPPEEVALHKAHGSLAKLLPCKAQSNGLTAVRDWILDHAHENGHKRIVLIDDDVDPQMRRSNMKITNCTPEECREAFEWIDGKLRTYAHASWGTRALDYDNPADELIGSRATVALGYDVAKVRKVGARFGKGLPAKFAVMGDFNMTLQLFKAGLPNAVSLVWRTNPRLCNVMGGCAAYRNAARVEECARALVKMYAPYAQLREKKSTWRGITGWKGDYGNAPERGTQWDVKVYWKKALAGGMQ